MTQKLKLTREHMEARRFLAAQLFQQGKGVCEVSRLLEVAKSSVSRWKAGFEKKKGGRRKLATIAFLDETGPEFIAQVIRRWLAQAGVETLYVAPASPWENGYAESFHSRLRDELTNPEEFTNLAEAKYLANAWRLEYNHRRPHSSLGYRTPAAFAARCAASVRATPSL